MLAPIAQRFDTELILTTGEASWTRVFEMAQRAAADARPAVVLYFADFDPGGHQMAVSVARKLQALRRAHFPNLNIRMQRAALTVKQVREYDLPETPLKETEKRKTRWKERFGREHTEIDALAALRPDLLTNIAITAILKFYDQGLDERVETAARQFRAAAERLLRNHPGYEELRQALEETEQATSEAVAAAQTDLTAAIDKIMAPMRPRLETARQQQVQALEDLRSLHDRIREELAEVALPEIVVPEPESYTAEQPEPLFTTDDDFVTATRKLQASKAYKQLEGEDDD